MAQSLICCYSTSCFFAPLWMMALFMDNQYSRLLLATVNQQESLLYRLPPPLRPINFDIVYQV